MEIVFEKITESLIASLSEYASRYPSLQKLGVVSYKSGDLSRRNLLALIIIAGLVLMALAIIPTSILVSSRSGPNYTNVPYIERPEYKGYVVELMSQPAKASLMGSQFKENENQILASHEEIKKRILKALNKESFVPVREEDVAGEGLMVKDAMKNKGNTKGVKRAGDKDIGLLGEYTTAFNGLALEITDDEATEIRKLSGVKRVVRNLGYQPTLMDSVPLIKADKVWSLKDGQDTAIKGSGVRVALVDSGINITHPDLGRCFPRPSAKTVDPTLTITPDCKIDGYDFVNNTDLPLDEDGHGTMVASIIASNGALKGVAPMAKIMAYKVCSATSCFNSNILEAIDAAIRTRTDANLNNRIQVMNLSLGTDCNRYYGGYTDECGPDDPLSRAVDRAVDAGIVVTVAAGNTGANLSTINSPGTARKVITVAAVDKNKVVAWRSSRGPVNWKGETIYKPDAAAPGVNICAAKGNPFLHPPVITCFDDRHALGSGTSMAAPHVAGEAALVIQAHPDWGPLQVKEAIIRSAENLGVDRNVQGAGLVDALAAVRASWQTPRPTPTPTPTLAPTPTLTPTPTPTPTPTSTSTPAPTQTPAPTPTPRSTMRPTIPPAQTPSPTLSPTARPTPTPTPTPSPRLPTPTPTPTSTPAPTPTTIPSGGQIVIKTDPSSAEITVGETTNVGVWVGNVSNLWGAQVMMIYDPKVVEVVSLNNGGFFYPDFGIQNFGGGKISYIYAQNGQIRQPVNGSGILFTITFMGVGKGHSAIQFVPATRLTDRNGYSLGTLQLQDGTLGVN